MTTRLLLLAILLTAFVAPASADMARYWIVGSYAKETNALNEQQRLQSISDFNIQIVPAMVNGRKYYRLATSQSSSSRERDQQQALLIAANIQDPWSLRLDLGVAPMERRMASPTPARTMEREGKMAAKPGLALIDVPKANNPPMPRTNKEYYEFCMKEANAAERDEYCGNDKLGREALFGR